VKKEYFTDSEGPPIKTVWYPVRWLSKLHEYRPKHVYPTLPNRYCRHTPLKKHSKIKGT